jgi:predicted phosphoribosyltransferase
MRFDDRQDAGRQLAAVVADHELVRGVDDVVVLGLPRGGVPVAAAVADRLAAVMDVLVVRKLGAPGHAEFGLGAAGEGGVQVIDHDLVDRLQVPRAHLDHVTDREQDEITRRVEQYRGGAEMVDVRQRTVVLVDDGIATGGTVRAAIDVLHAREAGRVVVAAPVASPRAVGVIAGEVDAVVVLHAPEDFDAVGRFYRNFAPTSDDEVVAALSR